ncbi:MAG: HAD-IIB family hydrolase [bacterium]|nr:HAD-IIB family hydrolase [bacterium]MDT8365769.1 HAD-IIB family hydrolase [bacterium]
MAEVIVFTDLDGTLLDHKSYGVRAALPAIDLLVRRGIPIIPVTSKTAAETRRWVKLLILEGPFICENGCGVVIPAGSLKVRPAGAVEKDGEWRISLGAGIEEVRRGLEELSESAGFSYRAFGQMSADELSSLTGLAGKELDQCLVREHEELFIILEEHDADSIGKKAAEKGLHFTQGGRFYHLTSGVHKGDAVKILANLYREELPDPLFVGIGDSFNDLPMFTSVDMPFLVQKPDGTYDPLVPEDAACRVSGVGPRGWRIAVERVMILG